MNRRDLLVAGSFGVVLGTSGCLDELDAAAENGIDDGSNGDSSPSRGLSVPSVDDAPDEYGIDLTVDVLASNLTGEAPPKLEISFENVGERVLARTGGPPVDIQFGDENAIYEDDPSGLFFLTESEREGLELDPEGCWSREHVVRENPTKSVYYAPGEGVTVRRTPIVIEDRLEEACPKPGEYPFVTSFSVHDETLEKFEAGEITDYTDGERVDCGFTLEITE